MPVRTERVDSVGSDGEYDGMQKMTIIESSIKYVDVISNSISDDMPDDIWKLHYISNEGFRRKEIHFVIESEIKIHIMKMNQIKDDQGKIKFEVSESFAFEKQFIEIRMKDKINSITLQNYAD